MPTRLPILPPSGPFFVYLQIVFPIEVHQVLARFRQGVYHESRMKAVRKPDESRNQKSSRSFDMSERARQYDRDYHKNIRRPKTLTNRAVDAATCQLCGDEWANTHVGWNAAIFVCFTCSAKLSNWDREKEMARRKMEALCQVCYIEPAESLHEASQLRCCCGCSAWLSEGEAEGIQRWKEVKGYPWDTDEKLGHLFETGAQFDLPPAVASLCGVKAPVWPIGLDMDMPPALRRFGLCVACLKACPDPAGIAYRERNYFAYVVPTSQEIAPAVGTS